jgi:hypothetical protein
MTANARASLGHSKPCTPCIASKDLAVALWSVLLMHCCSYPWLKLCGLDQQALLLLWQHELVEWAA